MTKDKLYTKAYFEERDHLDVHLAHSIMLLIKRHKLRKLLDVGCGSGKLVHFFNKKGYIAKGCDPTNSAIKAALRINKKESIIKASAATLPFENNSFDIITAISVIEHLTQREAEQFFAQAQRVLRSNGFIFIVTPNFASPWRFIQGKKWFGYSDPTHITFYTPKNLTALLQKYGFRNIQLQFKTIYNPPYMWEFAGLSGRLPKIVKTALTYLLISSPLRIIRNSFWMAAQKKD